MTARVVVEHEVDRMYGSKYVLSFQWCTWEYDDGSEPEQGFRFIWKNPDDQKLPHRGQARIPSAADLEALLNQARAAGFYPVPPGD